MLNNEVLLSYLPILGSLLIIPVFFYTAEKGLAISGFAVQFLVIFVTSFFMLQSCYLPYLVMGIYAFSVCCFLELRRLQIVRLKWVKMFIIPVIATMVAALFLILCFFSINVLREWMVDKYSPWSGEGVLLYCGSLFFVFTLIVHGYYIMAYSEYKVRYFVLSMLPYLLMFVGVIFFYSNEESYYFFIALAFWVLALGTAVLIKEYWLGKIRLIE